MDNDILQPIKTERILAENEIAIDKEYLQQTLERIRFLNKENTELITTISKSAAVVIFCKEILGNSLPKDGSMTEIMKFATKVPKLLKKFDSNTMSQLSKIVDEVLPVLQKYIPKEAQEKLIGTNEQKQLPNGK